MLRLVKKRKHRRSKEDTVPSTKNELSFFAHLSETREIAVVFDKEVKRRVVASLDPTINCFGEGDALAIGVINAKLKPRESGRSCLK